MISLSMTTATRVGLNLLALLGIVTALYLGKSIFVPLVIAVLLAALVWPTVGWLNRRLRFSWTLACMLVVFGLVVFNLLITLGFVLALPKMLQDMPDLRSGTGQAELYGKIREQASSVMLVDEKTFPKDANDSIVFGYVRDTLKDGTYITNVLFTIGIYGNNWLWQWILVMFILLFLLMEGRMLSRRVVEIFGPSLNVRSKVVETLTDMANAIRTYLVWRTLVNFALGVAVAVVYRWVFGLKQPWTWGLLTSVACYVPYLGPIVAGIPPIFDALLTHSSPWYAVGVVAFYLAIITLEGYVLVPVVMGRSMDLNATTVMLACLFWELVWGLPGLFLAMPLMAALKAICAHVPGWKPWANLMGANELEPPEKLAAATDPMEDTQLITLADAEAITAQRRAVMEKK